MELTEENVIKVLEELLPYIEAIIAKTGPTQTIRIEQAPLKIIGVSDTENKEPYTL